MSLRERPDAFVVRAVQPAEHGAVAELTVRVYGDVLGAILTDDYRAILSDVAHRAEQAEVLVAVAHSGALLGSVTYVPGPESEYAEFRSADEAGIRMLVVAPEAQRAGVGTRLVNACLDRARAGGRARVSLHTTASMMGAHRLYEGLGFVRAPERDWVPEPGVHLIAYLLVF